MIVGIGTASALQVHYRKARQTVLGGIERGMLSGQDDAQADASRIERGSDRCDLDCLGPGANDQPDMLRLQSSP